MASKTEITISKGAGVGCISVVVIQGSITLIEKVDVANCVGKFVIFPVNTTVKIPT